MIELMKPSFALTRREKCMKKRVKKEKADEGQKKGSKVVALDDLSSSRVKSTLLRREKDKKVSKKAADSSLAFNIDDYIVVRVGSRYIYGKATGLQHMIDSKTAHDPEANHVKFDPRFDLIAVLGPEPPAGGRVFGIPTDPMTHTISVDKMPPVYVYRALGDNKVKLVKDALKKFRKLCDDNNLVGLLTRIKHFELRSPQRKPAAYYSSFKNENWQDRMVLTPADVDEECVFEALVYGFAANLWQHSVQSSLRLSWLVSYLKARGKRRASDEDLESLLNQYKQVQTWKGLGSQVEERLEPLVPIVLKAITSSRKITAAEIDLLLREEPKTVERMWPSWAELPKTCRDDIPMESLASSNAYFQTLMTLHLRGKKLPSDLTSKCKKTMKTLVRF